MKIFNVEMFFSLLNLLNFDSFQLKLLMKWDPEKLGPAMHTHTKK